MPANEYRLQLYNQTENKLSRETTFKIELFDHLKPYVNEIINPKMFYKKGESIIFKTSNFDKFDARFYKIILIGTDKTIIQNGIYDDVKKTLSLNLPNSILNGNYTFEFALNNPIKNSNYSFKSNLTINIKD
jgi:hypothetical protein